MENLLEKELADQGGPSYLDLPKFICLATLFPRPVSCRHCSRHYYYTSYI